MKYDIIVNEDTISEYYIPKISSWMYDTEGHKRKFEEMRENIQLGIENKN